MASRAITYNYGENRNYVESTDEDEMLNMSICSESSEEEFELESQSKSTDKEYLPKRLPRNPKRKPTRKPDPNTFNRNALMARENRRRKKEYVEKLEKEINIYRGTNKNLRKNFKKQAKIIERLEKEKGYYRSILKNKSKILSVIKSLNTKECSLALPLINVTPERSPSYNGFSDITNNFGDIDYNLSFGNYDSWEDILGCNSPFCEERQEREIPSAQLSNLQEIQCNIIDEHNYFNTKIFYEDNDDLYSDAGVCLHFTGGKVSLEFCPTCHHKASNKTILDVLMDE